MNRNDYLIVGAGIAGLVMAWELEQRHPDARICILEKNSDMGGRLRMGEFEGLPVVRGAGVGRADKDVLLMQRIGEVGMEVVVKVGKSTSASPCDLLAIVRELKKLSFDRHTEDFETFYRRHRDDFEAFCVCVGYTDFTRADIVDTLEDYGFDDCLPKLRYFPVDWDELIRRLAARLVRTQIHCDSKVVSIDPISRCCTTESGKRYRCRRQIILATTRSGLDAIQNMPDFFYRQIATIHAQPFLRMYARLSSPLGIKNMTKTENALQKILPMDDQNAIYMLSYSDNEHARRVYRHKNLVEELVAPRILLDSKSYYYREGTHYYSPLPRDWTCRQDFIHYVQHPHPNLVIVGEMISKNQGWTEGALESIRDYFLKINK
jgi:hypothetical protein